MILHRDISPSNIMYDMGYAGEKPHFVLNDFDLAVKVAPDGSSREPTANHRTGTLPFLAVEHLRDLRKGTNVREDRLYHDYQSLFWVAVYCMIKYNRTTDGKK